MAIPSELKETSDYNVPRDYKVVGDDEIQIFYTVNP